MLGLLLYRTKYTFIWKRFFNKRITNPGFIAYITNNLMAPALEELYANVVRYGLRSIMNLILLLECTMGILTMLLLYDFKQVAESLFL